MSDSTPEATGASSAPIEDSQVQPVSNSADTPVVNTPDENGDETRSGEQTATPSSDNTNNDSPSDGPAASQFDDDLDDWASKRGYEAPTTDKERKLMQDIRNGQRDFHKQRSNEVNDEVNNLYEAPEADEFTDPTEQAIQEIRQTQARQDAVNQQRDFFDANPEARQYESAMAKALAKERDTNGVDAARWLAKDLKRLYTLVKADTSADDISAASEQARQDERESLAKRQSASAPKARASTTEKQPEPKGEDVLRNMSTQDWHAKRLSGWNPIRDL